MPRVRESPPAAPESRIQQNPFHFKHIPDPLRIIPVHGGPPPPVPSDPNAALSPEPPH